MAVVFLFSLYLGILIGQVCCENESHSCVQTDPCLCSYNAYEKINLWPLGEVSTSTGSSNLNVSYFFHACKDVKFDPKQCGLNLTSNTCVDEASVCTKQLIQIFRFLESAANRSGSCIRFRYLSFIFMYFLVSYEVQESNSTNPGND